MPLDSRRRVLCAIMAYAILSSLPAGAAGQPLGDPPALAPGVHELKLARAGEPAINYAISIPANYSPAKPVPLILALHFGVGGGDAAGAGSDGVQIPVGPAVQGVSALILAPGSVPRHLSTAPNKQA